MSGLESASKYLNNLLLARGFLQNGKPIDFAHPDQGSQNCDATVTKIINLVHELVLRRDRESEQQEAMVGVIRALRLEESQRVLDLQRVQDKNIRLKGDIVTAEAQERAAQVALRKVEAQVRDLKDQTLKLKVMLDQVRAKCTGDLRKRDLEIEKLKGHISGLQRGKKEGSGIRINTINPQTYTPDTRERRIGQNVTSTDWSLETASNEFLADLVNETSTENVALRHIVDDTIQTLKSLTGLESSEVLKKHDDAIGIPGQYRVSHLPSETEALVSCENLADRVNLVLNHCRSILKDPSFVPIEEVQARDEEIIKLTEGWEKMADRWKEAVTMMAQWKQKMLDDGREAEVEDFSDLSFGRSVAVRPDGKPVLSQYDELSLIYEQSELSQDMVEESTEEGAEAGTVSEIKPDVRSKEACSSVDGHMSLYENNESDLELEPEPARKRLATSPAKRGVRLPRPSRTLTESNGNTVRKQAGTEADSESSSLSLAGKQRDVENNAHYNKPRSRLPQPINMTISEKLAAVEAEADAVEEHRLQGATHKRKASSRKNGLRKTSRRRSTLNPAELAALMGV